LISSTGVVQAGIGVVLIPLVVVDCVVTKTKKYLILLYTNKYLTKSWSSCIISEIGKWCYDNKTEQKDNSFSQEIEPCIFYFPGSRTNTILERVLSIRLITEGEHLDYSVIY
jgi:hypothetical protein